MYIIYRVECSENPVFPGYEVTKPQNTYFDFTLPVEGCARGYKQSGELKTDIKCTADGWSSPNGCVKIGMIMFITAYTLYKSEFSLIW